MALLTALLAYLGRQLSTLVQAILGWSVTALFGRLPSIKQTALSVALLVSLLWPVAIVGIFVPAVSAWAFAFLPLQKWMGAAIVRWATVALALLLPLVVGGITRWVAPAPTEPRSILRTVWSAFPLTLGYGVACVLTAVTVPLVKLASAVRGWSDEHVYVQPRPGEYDKALRELLGACLAAEAPAHVEAVPTSMRLATTVLRWFARAAVAPIMTDELKRVRGDGIELYLYPADLLLRGKPAKVARVRATITRTWLERYAFTVSDPGAQALQDELQRMWQIVRRHRDPRQIGATAFARLREIGHDLDRTAAPFEQWVTLDRSLHRVERALGGGADILKDDLAYRDVWEENPDRSAPRDGNEDHAPEENQVMAMTIEGPRPVQAATAEESTGQLIREALDETRDLVRLEVALAREELRGQIAQAKTGAMALGGAIGFGMSAFTLLLMAIVFAFAQPWLGALVVGGSALGIAAVLALVGWKALPKKPMSETRTRLESDLKQFKERVA